MNQKPLMIDKVVMIRSRGDGQHVGVNGRIIILIATVVLPLQLAVLSPFKSLNVAVGVGHRVIDVQTDPAPQERRSQAKLKSPTC